MKKRVRKDFYYTLFIRQFRRTITLDGSTIQIIINYCQAPTRESKYEGQYQGLNILLNYSDNMKYKGIYFWSHKMVNCNFINFLYLFITLNTDITKGNNSKYCSWKRGSSVITFVLNWLSFRFLENDTTRTEMSAIYKRSYFHFYRSYNNSNNHDHLSINDRLSIYLITSYSLCNSILLLHFSYSANDDIVGNNNYNWRQM